MHELSITRNIVAIVADHAPGQKVSRVVVAIGELSGIAADAVQFCFELCAKDSPVEGAELVIEHVAGRGRCDACALEVPLEQPFGACETCGARLRVVAGEELLVKSMEVDDVRDMRMQQREHDTTPA